MPLIPLFVQIQLAAPISDVTLGSWEGVPAGSPTEVGSPTELWPMIDEVVADDADYIQSVLTPTNDTCEVLLTSLSDPIIHTGHIVRYRYNKQFDAGQIDLTVKLMQGGTEIASWSHSDISVTLVTAEQTLTGAQVNAITDYTDLRLRFTADQP